MPKITDYVAPVLAFTLILSLMLALLVAMFHPLPKDNHDIIIAVFGALITSVTGAVGFFFGSSQSSQNKDQALQDIAKGP